VAGTSHQKGDQRDDDDERGGREEEPPPVGTADQRAREAAAAGGPGPLVVLLEVDVVEHAPAHVAGRRERRRDGEQGGRADPLAAPGSARGARIRVLGDPRPRLGVAALVPIGEQGRQLRALVAAVACHQVGAERPFDAVDELGDEVAGVLAGHADGVGQLLALEALAEVEVEEGTVGR
jgi:hypothetical protein